MSDAAPANSAPVKRGRGRPRKDPSAPQAAKKADSVSNGAKVPGKRGRKPGSTNKPKPAPKAAPAQGAKRGRGRPRKSESEKKAKPAKKAKKAETSESEGQEPSSQEESDE